MADLRVATCRICNEPFEAPHPTGQTPELCSDACRRVAQSERQKKYIRRLIDARHQLAALLAA